MIQYEETVVCLRPSSKSMFKAHQEVMEWHGSLVNVAGSLLRQGDVETAVFVLDTAKRVHRAIMTPEQIEGADA